MNTRAGQALALAGSLLIAGCSSTPGEERLTPSAMAIPFDSARYRDFGDYIAQTRDALVANKAYLNPANTDAELAAAVPFERAPAGHCGTNSPARGILLIHGLSDMPFAMRDLSAAFAERCFLVRALLLPGHGARPADLLTVNRDDWTQAVRFGLETLKRDTDAVYVGGFSLGGLLAVQAATHDPDIRGVFAFSPALSLHRAWLLRQASWLRHLIDWVDTDPADDYARFEAMPVNGLAETFGLSGDLHAALLRGGSLSMPVFMAQSSDDAVVNAADNQVWFERFFTHPDSRLINYRQGATDAAGTGDARIKAFNSHLPGQRIVGFSHQAVHASPHNPHYGVAGRYRNCGINAGRSADEAARCLDTDTPWFTEIIGEDPAALPADVVPARLTFNPLFDEMMGEIDLFLESGAD